VLALEQVTRDDGSHRRSSCRGGKTTNGPVHAVGVSPPPRPETDLPHPDSPALAWSITSRHGKQYRCDEQQNDNRDGEEANEGHGP
jgi:hypothetical protein